VTRTLLQVLGRAADNTKRSWYFYAEDYIASYPGAEPLRSSFWRGQTWPDRGKEYEIIAVSKWTWVNLWQDVYNR